MEEGGATRVKKERESSSGRQIDRPEVIRTRDNGGRVRYSVYSDKVSCYYVSSVRTVIPFRAGVMLIQGLRTSRKING